MLKELYQTILRVDDTMAQKGSFPALRTFETHIKLGHRKWESITSDISEDAITAWIKQALPSVFAPGGRQEADGWNTIVGADWFLNFFETEADVDRELLPSLSDYYPSESEDSSDEPGSGESEGDTKKDESEDRSEDNDDDDDNDDDEPGARRRNPKVPLFRRDLDSEYFRLDDEYNLQGWLSLCQ